MSNNERYSNKQVKQRYFDRRPDVVKIFDDLDAYLNFCRIELLPYNPADLYNKNARTWQIYEKSIRAKRYWNNHNNSNNNNTHNNNNNNNNRPGARVNKPRSH